MTKTDLIQRIANLKISHYRAGDGWHSCPLSGEEYVNPDRGDQCTCDALEQNAKVDELLAELEVES